MDAAHEEGSTQVPQEPLSARFDLLKRDGEQARQMRAPRGEIDAAYQEIVALVTSGELTADIDSTFRLEQYADALSRAEHYRRHGKVLFVFGD